MLVSRPCGAALGIDIDSQDQKSAEPEDFGVDFGDLGFNFGEDYEDRKSDQGTVC